MGVRSLSGQDIRTLIPASSARSPQQRPQVDELGHGGDQSARDGPQIKKQQLEHAVKVLNEDRRSLNTGVRMRIDSSTHRIVAQILDENGQVLKQIPPEEVLKLAAKIRRLQGLLFDEQA